MSLKLHEVAGAVNDAYREAHPEDPTTLPTVPKKVLRHYAGGKRGKRHPKGRAERNIVSVRVAEGLWAAARAKAVHQGETMTEVIERGLSVYVGSDVADRVVPEGDRVERIRPVAEF